MNEPIDVHVRRIIAEVLEISIDQVSAEMHFINDLAANSLDIVELVMRLEEDFGIEVPDEAVEGVRHVSDIIQFARGLFGDADEADADGSQPHPQLVIASDHAGFTLKERLKAVLHDLGWIIRDAGTNDGAPVDYTSYAEIVSRAVGSGDSRLGVLICGTGIGMAIAANKVSGVRAATVHSELEARLAREHNDANVLCLGARILGVDQAESCLRAFLSASFDEGDDGRHRRRVDAIRALEGVTP